MLQAEISKVVYQFVSCLPSLYGYVSSTSGHMKYILVRASRSYGGYRLSCARTNVTPWIENDIQRCGREWHRYHCDPHREMRLADVNLVLVWRPKAVANGGWRHTQLSEIQLHCNLIHHFQNYLKESSLLEWSSSLRLASPSGSGLLAAQSLPSSTNGVFAEAAESHEAQKSSYIRDTHPSPHSEDAKQVWTAENGIQALVVDEFEHPGFSSKSLQ